MTARTSKRLVVDASVARAAGREKAVFPRSKHCRDFLIAILEICHRAVMTTEIRNEWDKHQSNFARGWRVSMVARKKLLITDAGSNSELRKKIQRHANKVVERAAMLKDLHLIEAALATDRIVASLDETARVLFAEVTNSMGEIKEIVWVNPDSPKEGCLSWLKSGARAEKKRQLGFRK